MGLNDTEVAMPAATKDHWEIEDAARTLIRAEEIKADKPLLTKARREAAKQAKVAAKAAAAGRKVAGPARRKKR
jgi:hypothetical protein